LKTTLRHCASGIVCGGLTIVKVRDSLQDVAVGIKGLRPTDLTGGIPMRVQDDLGVDEAPGGNSLVQSLAKSSSGRHTYGPSDL